MAKSARDPGDLRNRLFLRKNELAYVLGCSTTSISHWVRSGKIPKPIKIGGTPTKAEELYQLLKRYAVTREFRPLAIGAKEEIQAAFPEFALEDVAVVLRRHCKHGKYLTALVKGEQRFHLNGEPAGAIKQLHKDKAAALLETQKKRRAAREQALKAPPKKVEPKAFELSKPKPQITAAAPKTPDQISPDVSGTRPKLTLKKKEGQP